jgi:hypothetical protein
MEKDICDKCIIDALFITHELIEGDKVFLFNGLCMLLR